MSEIKVRLSVVLPGRIMLSEQECSKNPKESYKHESVSIPIKGHKWETIHYAVRKYRTAKEVVNISLESYKYMISNEVPSWMSPKIWKQLNAKERLNEHMKRISESLNGLSYTFEVFN